MKIQELHIQNYKSLVDLKIIEPNPFTVFAGSNGAGKSNIFEALELFCYSNTMAFKDAFRNFGGLEELKPKTQKLLLFEDNALVPHLLIQFIFDKLKTFVGYSLEENQENELYNSVKFSNFSEHRINHLYNQIRESDSEFRKIIDNDLKIISNKDFVQFVKNYQRIFISSTKRDKNNFDDDLRLNTKATNLEKVLKRVLKDENKREDICEWLDLLVPGFDKIEIVSEPLSGTDSLIIYEKGTKKPYTKNLLSDGTYNILALLTAVYQSDEPQFLCIEEPENGLNPKVQKELVNLFRQKCEEEGHYIWINTHSQTIVNQLTTKELILVDKVDGATQIKQLQSFDTSGLPMDEAWLTNTLGGGIPW